MASSRCRHLSCLALQLRQRTQDLAVKLGLAEWPSDVEVSFLGVETSRVEAVLKRADSRPDAPGFVSGLPAPAQLPMQRWQPAMQHPPAVPADVPPDQPQVQGPCALGQALCCSVPRLLERKDVQSRGGCAA